ncbi:MAG: hypothetical protein K0R49_1452, partial [Burkholderiales bacterium]|nr:hypothetical protein [Burkholderiales bacterium]
DTILDEANIKIYLSHKFPEYMIPQVFIYLDTLPLTISGKVDKTELLKVKFTRLETNNYLAPQGELESKVCNIFEQVLNLKQGSVGVTDDFFRLGGDSILSIRIVSKLKQIGINVSVAELYVYRNVKKLLLNTNIELETIDYIPFNLISEDVKYKLISNDPSNIEDIFPASYLQTGMLLESVLQGAGTYHDVFSYLINDEFNEVKFNNIWNQLVAKYELLRAKFVLVNDGWLVLIMKQLVCRCQIFNIELDLIIENERLNSFNFGNTGLFRLIINKIDNKFNLIFSFHHAICDGWSVASLINEFIQAYVNNKKIKPNIPLSYGEFIHNEQMALKEANQIDFWKSYLINLELYKVKWKLKKTSSKSGLFTAVYELDKSYLTKLHILVNQESVSLDSVFIYAYMSTLWQFIGRSDICIGLVVNNRIEKEGGDKCFGLFLNTIPFRLQVNSSLNLHTIFNEKIKLYKYKHVPYGYIKSMFASDVYEFAFNFVHFHSLNDSRDEIIETSSFERTNIPFVINVSQRGLEKICLSFVAHDTFIDQEYLDYFRDYFVHNLKLILNQNYHNCLIEADYPKIIYDYNKEKQEYPQNKTINQLFEEQVDKTPNNIAVVYENTQLTYKELNQQSNQLANYLRAEYKIKGDDLIALSLTRSKYMLIAILGVLKSGAGYVPIDPDFPIERVTYILKDIRAKILITETYCEQIEEIPNKFYEHCNMSPNILVIDDKKFIKILKKYSPYNLRTDITNKNLAYVIYTSGTTGRPKGVMVEHRSVINTIQSLRDIYNVKENCRVSFFTSYIFDVSVSEIFTTLLYGCELYVFPEEFRRDSDAIGKFLYFNKINICYLPPVLLASIHKQDYPDLITLIYAGEPCDYATGNYWSKHKKLYNYYGPTETSIYCIGKQVINGDVNLIGRPLNNITVYILDNNLNPLPLESIGGLYIGGIGLARGYLNQPDLTNLNFLKNPFQTETEKQSGINARIYKTGDLVRMLSNGNIEYIGRDDLQIKIRGFRIEPNEIENILQGYQGVKHSVVLTKECSNKEGVVARNKYLVAYYVSDKKLDEILIREYLGKVLPIYSIPDIIIRLKSLPLTLSGKLDRDLLCKLEINLKDIYVAPFNNEEVKICSIYSEILRMPVKQIGIHSDFFKLGGNSILAINLLYKLQQEFIISLNDIFNLRTPAKIAKLEPSKKNNLYQKLIQMKFYYDKLSSYEISPKMQRKKTLYQKEVEQFGFIKQLKRINNVLLTGATGHFGCNILYQLLHETNYKIYLLVRAKSNTEAFRRISRKFKYYFDISLDIYKERIITIAADIGKIDLNINNKQYQKLID